MALDLDQYRTALDNFIKDHEQLNRLLKFTEENTEDELDLYLNMALGFLNHIPPPIGDYTFATFPMPSLLIHQATIECLISNSIVAARNDLTYNNGGVTVKIQDGDRYLKLLQLLYRTTDIEISMFKQTKIGLNISGGWGGIPSPYSSLHGRYATLQPNTILSG
jgi:hypothetical protein